MDLLLDRSSHDLVFVNGECPVTDGRTDAVVQRLYIRLRTFLGEWYLNAPYGVPWLERILGHKTRKSTIDKILQKQIMGVSGVERIVSFSSTWDNPRRHYSCTFTVKTDEGLITPEITISQG